MTPEDYVPIPVIASFNGKGSIHVLYIQIKGERYKVLSCKETNKSLYKDSYTIYDISVLVNGVAKAVEIQYQKPNCLWCVKRKHLDQYETYA